MDWMTTVGVPVLTKSIELLFSEAPKVLKAWRERKAAEGNDAQPDKAVPAEAVTSKEEAETLSVSAAAVSRHQQQLEHLNRLLDTHLQNYWLAKEQAAKWGDALVPAIIMHNRRESEQKVVETARELAALVSQVYGKRVAPPHLD